MTPRPFEAFLRFIPQAPTWDDVLVGYDFSLLRAEEIQAWAGALVLHGAAANRLIQLEGEALLAFEVCLWEACQEATGQTPRPGMIRWIAAHDRWRVALLKDLLTQDFTSQGLAERIEALYGEVGCPEDMLDMFSPAQQWSKKPAKVNPWGVASFLCRLESLPNGLPDRSTSPNLSAPPRSPGRHLPAPSAA